MVKYLLHCCWLTLLLVGPAKAQRFSPVNCLAVSTADVVSSEYIPETVDNQMKQRLNALLASAGISSESYFNRFVIRPTYEIVNKEVVPGPPTKYCYEVTIGLSLVDNHSKKIFASFLGDYRAVGNNETKTIISTINQLRADNAELARFFDEAKRKMLEYYEQQAEMLEYNDQQAEQMIRRAYALAEMNEEESAICMLAEIPQECRRYNDALDAMVTIHKRLSNRECVDRLNQARIIWAGSKHGKRLQDIVSLLIGIDSRASCYGDVLAFIQQVSREKGKYEDREWDLLLNRGENPHAVTQLEIETARAIAESHTPEETMGTR